MAEAEKVWTAPKDGESLTAGRKAAEGMVREEEKRNLETPELIVDMRLGSWRGNGKGKQADWPAGFNAV